MASILRELESSVASLAERYYLAGADRADVAQEARIALVRACGDYRKESGRNLYGFLRMAMERAVITAMISARRKKHHHLNDAVSFSTLIKEGGFDLTEEIGDRFLAEDRDHEKEVLDRIEMRGLMASLRLRLTPLEREVLDAHRGEEGYADVAQKTDATPKAVDNALMRVRMKASQVWTERERQNGSMTPLD